MATEYRMIYHYRHWLKVKLADPKRNVMVNVKGAEPFVISRADWDKATIAKGDDQ